MKHWKKAVGMLLALAVILTAGLTVPARSRTARAEETPGDITIANADTQWQYRDDNKAPAEGWKTSEVVTEDGWKEAKGSFGAKNGAISDLGGGCIPNTLLAQYIEGESGDVIPVYYFRTTFDVADPSAIQNITGQLLYDDAAVVYINGVRVAGFYDESFDEQGYGGSNKSAPLEGEISYTDIAALNLKESGNVLAVELHNGRASSSDIYLDVKSLVLGTQGPEEQEAEVKYVSLNIGSDETQRNITWMGTSGSEAYVQLAVRPQNWKEGDAFPSQAQSFQAASTAASFDGLYSCKATMTGIQGNTTYLYRVGNEEKWSDIYQFTTQETGEGKSFSFLFAGDPQIGAGSTASDIVGWKNTMDRAMAAFPQTSFLLSAGDQINDKGSKEEAQYEGFLSPDALRQVPLAANVGNHDSGSLKYTDFFNMPNVSALGTSNNTGAGSGDYWFEYNGVLMMSINSNNQDTAVHKAFLEQTLAAHPDASWKIVTFHHSTYSVANHYTDTDIVKRRTELSPVFSELGIDAVLMGHDHYYTRTYMMDGSNAVVPEGYDVTKGEQAPESVTNPEEGQVFYLTANSASGSKYYSRNGELANGWPEYVAVQDQSQRTSITNVTVTETSFTVDTYYTDSDQLTKMDSFTIYHENQTEEPDDGQKPDEDQDGSQNQSSTVTPAQTHKAVKASPVKTGDTAFPAVWAGCILLAAAGCASVVVYRHSRRKEGRG